MPDGEVSDDAGEWLSLKRAADELGVHYMTAYRYVRTGRLPAQRHGSQWSVRRDALASLVAPAAAGRAKRGAATSRRDYVRALAALLVAGDETQAWRLLQDALASAFDTERLYLDVVAPAMHLVGDDWAAGRVSVAGEHRATALAYRLVGRLGATCVTRGPARGTVVLGALSGDRHGLASALVADPLRGRGFAVADLGADTPAASFAETVARDDRTFAVGIVVSVPVGDDIATATIDAIHAARVVPVIVGGCAVANADHATALGADAYSESARAAVEWFEHVHDTRATAH